MFDKTIIHEHIYGSPIEICEYNPEKDLLAIFVGTEDDIPPQEIIEEIYEKLKKIGECNLVVFPGLIKLVILKGEK
jgi:hypothetical protein